MIDVKKDMKTYVRGYADINCTFLPYLGSEYTSHPKDIEKIMIEKLKNFSRYKEEI